LEFLLNGKKFITGDAPKIVDFFIYESADLLKALDPATFKQYPNVERSHSAFRALPPIQVILFLPILSRNTLSQKGFRKNHSSPASPRFEE
jgi:hypothetical protein